MPNSIEIDLSGKNLSGEIKLPLSKSLHNRALVLAALYPLLKVNATADSDDVLALTSALQKTIGEVNISAAGTAMRFATAYFAATPGTEVVLTGTARMQKRPIGILVDALKTLGAEISYQSVVGFPPLAIKGKRLRGGELFVPSNRSSQFISALMLIGPLLENGITIRLVGKVVSKPYINMTAGLMNQLGFQVEVQDDLIRIHHQQKIAAITYTPEADWSAAAFWYGLVSTSKNGKVELKGLAEDSLQGDKRLVRIFEELGVKTSFNNEGAVLEKRAALLPNKLVVNLLDNPDLAQPLAFTCAALGISADLRGLQTLRIKETNRLMAIQNELAKVGVDVAITDATLRFEATKLHKPTVPFETYEDHRMAMSAAILATQFPLSINNPEVVSKSYPNFWVDLAGMG